MTPTTPAASAPRALTLLEVMIVVVITGVLAAAAGTSLSEQARRTRAQDALSRVLLPHLQARDLALASRGCAETFLIPAASVAYTAPGTVPGGVLPTQGKTPVVVVVQWSACVGTATAVRVTVLDLEGDVSFTQYDTADGRLVFGPDGGLSADRPGVAAAAVVNCGPADGSSVGACTPPTALIAPPPDASFALQTFFGATRQFKVFARVGQTATVL